jgi:hypothetical protein
MISNTVLFENRCEWECGGDVASRFLALSIARFSNSSQSFAVLRGIEGDGVPWDRKGDCSGARGDD